MVQDCAKPTCERETERKREREREKEKQLFKCEVNEVSKKLATDTRANVALALATPPP